MTGYTVPPLRAVFDGVPGASTKSANVIAYPKPSVLPRKPPRPRHKRKKKRSVLPIWASAVARPKPKPPRFAP